MFAFSLLAAIFGAMAFALVLATHPDGFLLGALRAVALAVSGLILLWGVLGLLGGVQSSRRIEAYRAERARLTQWTIPASEIEVIDATFGPGERCPRLEARIRNHSKDRTLYFLSYRWRVSFCQTPDNCRQVGWEIHQDLDGISPDAESRYKIDLDGLDLGPRGLNLLPRFMYMQLRATIDVLEARGS